MPETLKKQIINSLFYLSLSEQGENKIRKVFDRVNAIWFNMRSSVWWYKTWHKKYAIMFHIYTNICIYFNDFIFIWKYYSVYVLLILFFFLLHKMSSVLCFQMTESLVTEQIIKKIVIVSKVILIFVSKNRNYEFQMDQMFIFFSLS